MLLRGKCCNESLQILHRLLVGNYMVSRAISSRSMPRIDEEEIRRRILHRESRDKLVRRLRGFKGKDILSENTKSSAVLMPLCIVKDQVSLLYTMRSPFLKNHGGQVSFPGGKSSEEDKSLADTAIRETEEEIGYSRSNIDVWMIMANVPDRRGKYKITPVLGYLPSFEMNDLSINPKEVHEVFTMSIQELLDPVNQSYTQFNNGWRMPIYLYKNYKIWGITACLTELFLAKIFPEYYSPKFHLFKGNIREKFMK